MYPIDCLMTQIVEVGLVDMIEPAIVNGANINVYNGELLKIASMNGHLDVIKKLHDLGINASDYIINVSLELAARGGHLQIVDFLLNTMNADINYEDGAALRYASIYHKIDTVKYIVDNGASKDTICKSLRSVIDDDEVISILTDALNKMNGEE